MKYYLGVDVGSSKTHTLITDDGGQCIGFGKSIGGNHQGVGYEGLEFVLKESFKAALQMASIVPAQIAGAGFGIAGYDFPSDRNYHLKTISTLGLSCPIEIVNDGELGLFAGTKRGIGVNVTAGSSVNCCGRGENGSNGRIVGNGMDFGEHGGAAEIVQRGLHMVNYAWIKRIPPTALTRVYLEATGASNEMDLMEGLSNRDYSLLPSLAIEVIRVSMDGDPAAREVTQWAGEELGWLAVAVARQLGMENDPVIIVQSGSIFDAGEVIITPMREIVHRYCPNASLMRLDGPPVVGAVVLGMVQSGFNGFTIRKTLVQTSKEFLK